MRTIKIILITICSFSLFACNKAKVANSPDSPYVEGQTVELAVDIVSTSSNAPSRQIVGPYNKDPYSPEMTCQWEIQPEDQLYVIYGGNTSTFTLKTLDSGIATFEGTMPSGWEPGNKFDVVAGVDPSTTTPPTSADVEAGYDGIRSGMMRFEGEATDINDPIILTAVWSAMRVSIQFTPEWDAEITGEGGYSSDAFKIVLSTIEVQDQEGTTLYTYACKNKGVDGIDLKPSAAASGTTTVDLTSVVAPGTYSSFIYKITVNKALCGDTVVEPVASAKSSYRFKFADSKGIGQSLTLAENEFLVQASPAEIKMMFQKIKK